LTEDILANAATSPDIWSAFGNPSKIVCIAPPDDDSTTFIWSGFDDQQFDLSANTIPAGSTINSVSVMSRCRHGGTATDLTLRLYLGANYTESATHTLNAGWTSYADLLARPAGGAWQLADLATLEMRAHITDSSYLERQITTMYIQVDYTPPAPAAVGDMLLCMQ
jgi:hypothetical protein